MLNNEKSLAFAGLILVALGWFSPLILTILAAQGWSWALTLLLLSRTDFFVYTGTGIGFLVLIVLAALKDYLEDKEPESKRNKKE